MNIIDKVRYVIKKGKLVDKGDRVVVGVSGGADSVCLLYLLSGLKEDLKISLHIAHLDHGLRKESEKDAKFVKMLAEELNIPVAFKRVNVKRIAGKLSVEEAARNLRLEFLLQVAKRVKAQKIALAHNFDDQAETVIMRILRGTGLYGLSAILPKRKMGRVFIIRPLLNIKRSEIEAFLKSKGIKFCIDKTNNDECYLRNKIRHRLLPLLEKDYNKNIREAFFALAKSAGSDYDYLKGVVARTLKGSHTKLQLKSLAGLHPSIMRLKLREAISFLQRDTRRITFKHIQELEDLILNRPQGSIVDLPKGVSALKKQKMLVFYLR
ncbi:MAG: tRNA lysidine(34) synthetase TilS [Candidatus Omnitrophica bacterium]|nr:tRNA lysidine(34) synthetase TilS [Candidatus Omnitrophota bacterium]